MTQLPGHLSRDHMSKIIRAPNSAMYRMAIAHLQRCQSHASAAQLAAVWRDLARQISDLSGGSWSATHSRGTDGSYISCGEYGEALVISPHGELYRGRLAAEGGGLNVSSSGLLEPSYERLQLLR